MRVSYFPGCTLRTKAKELDLQARKCAQALGVELCEIENWQCCGGVFVTAKDEVASKLSSVRVEFSKQALMTVNPPSTSVCLAAPRFNSTHCSASSSR